VTADAHNAQDAAMPLSAHLAELRTRLMWSFIVIGATAVAAFAFHKQIIELLLVPFPDNVEIVQIDVSEGVSVSMKVALLAGFVVAFPVILYQVVMFVRPALLEHEKRFLYASLPVVAVLFIGGVAFSFLVPIPFMMRVLPTFLSDLATPQIRVESVVGTTLWLMFAMGLVFELPVIMFLLARVGILDPGRVARQRRLAVFGAFVAAAVITPTGDPINMVVWGLPIWLLFEVGLVFARLAWWWRAKALAKTLGASPA
jgi:sec-independent protein translocase protein TatC